MNFVIDFDSLKQTWRACQSLFESKNNSLFVVATANNTYEGVEQFLTDSKVTYEAVFIGPEKGVTAWKANTAKALKPGLYIDSDSTAIEQARALGVPSALFRI